MTKEPKYGEAMAEIEAILEQIESGELDVDDLSEKVKRVASLIALCKKKLRSTESEIQKVIDNLDDTAES